jgi:hypothetical protein
MARPGLEPGTPRFSGNAILGQSASETPANDRFAIPARLGELSVDRIRLGAVWAVNARSLPNGDRCSYLAPQRAASPSPASIARWHPARMPFTVDKAELERYATKLDREAAVDLDGALGWFGAHEDGATFRISRHDLQQFLHYTLPHKYLAEVEEHVAVAKALGDALEHLGAPAEYAELCRSPETLGLLALWAVDEDAAFARMVALIDASGLEPPDVAELQWQGVMGIAEAQARDAATLAIERALEAGEARPAAEIVRAVLAEPDPDGVHPTRLLAVHAERIDRWAGWRSSPRRALLEPLIGDLVDPQVPEWPADDLLDWLLEAPAGLALTQRGALSRALATEIARRRPQWSWGRSPRSESDVANLETLHSALRRSGLVRRRGQALLVTKRAGELSPGARRVFLLEGLLEGDAFLAAVAELALAALAQDVPDAGDQIAEVIAADGWRDDGGALPRHAVPAAAAEARRLLLAIGAAEGDSFGRNACTLTEPGRSAVLCALGAHAVRARAAIPLVPGGASADFDLVSEVDHAVLDEPSAPVPRPRPGGNQRVRERRKAQRAARRRNRR